MPSWLPAIITALGFARDVVKAATAKEPLPPRVKRRDLDSIAAESAKRTPNSTGVAGTCPECERPWSSAQHVRCAEESAKRRTEAHE